MGAWGQFRPLPGGLVRMRDAFVLVRLPCEKVERRLAEREGLVRRSGERFIGCCTVHYSVRLVNN